MSYRILLPEKAAVGTAAIDAVAAAGSTKPGPKSDSGGGTCSAAVAGGEAFCAESPSKKATAAPCAGVWGGAEVCMCVDFG